MGSEIEIDDKAKLASAGGQLSFGAASGLVSGYALRQGGKVVGLLAGTGFLFLQSLSYLGYIEVNWRKVERSYKNILDRNGDGVITSEDFKLLFKDTNELLKFNLPSGSGFTAGLAYGLSGSLRMTALAPVAYGGAISLALGGIPFDIMDECQKLGIATPRDALSSIPVVESIQNNLPSFGTLQKLGSRMQNMSNTRSENPLEKYKPLLKSLELQELRDLEAKVKTSNGLDVPELDLLGYTVNDKGVLLTQIEEQKKIVKGR
mmetsp:Transcript_7817/g.8966  ORF Transcript_7817/g.8966 Transcript_7817/m.8966 type:complete len:262 (-) Transcript_7817:849-1634(-)|eukprot:CAMPEP_0184017306 /NCGR_PEP_ID=MMETSP0954-20121128/7454_1 /TAXON_ID=627963 /ORGANISM="Aplanochytrium sp, Strain PBS07" /LENGTH=261 /DNA_ID=CAMNT_0026298509 /DNA_START=117 /DNA_END=902 /DNA_ORIENTATION=+